MANPQQLANELLIRYKLKRPTLEDIVFLVGENGYEIIDFEPGSPSAESLFRELSLNEAVCSQDAFLYTNHNVKLLFLKDSLDADEKRYAAAHELGHIVCGHSQTRPSVKEEYEANEFVHYFLNPSARLRARNMTARHKWRTAFIILTIALVVAVGIFACPFATGTHTPYKSVLVSSNIQRQVLHVVVGLIACCHLSMYFTRC